MIRAHADPGEDLEGPVDVAAPQQVVDALWAGGVGPLQVARPVGEEVAELGVRQDAAVPVACDLYGVLRLHVGGGGVIGGDPCRQLRARPSPDGQLRAVQRAQGLVDPLHVERLGQLEGEVAVGARDAAPGVHVDGRHSGLLSPKPERRSGDPTGRGLIGHAALAPAGRQRGQARVVDVGRLAAAAAPDVAALALDDRPSPQQLAGRRREEAGCWASAGSASPSTTKRSSQRL